MSTLTFVSNTTFLSLIIFAILMTIYGADNTNQTLLNGGVKDKFIGSLAWLDRKIFHVFRNKK